MSIINRMLRPITVNEIESTHINTSDTDILPVCPEPDNMTVSLDKKTDLSSYFKSKGFELKAYDQNSYISPVEKLAFLIAANYNECRSFLKHIRDSIVKKCFHVNFSLTNLSGQEKNAVIKVAEKFDEYGIIANFYYNRNTEYINGLISSCPRIINFINGDYLEFFGRSVAERVIKEIADRHCADYEIFSNAVIIDDHRKQHELDIVFRVGHTVFWSEIKSGKFSDFDSYRKLGILLGVNPDCHILLAAEKSEEATEAISWFYQFYVANISNFRDKLEKMIENSFEGGKNND